MFYLSISHSDYTHTHTHTHIYIYIYIYAYRLLVGKPEGKRPLGIPRRRWVDNIKMDFLEIGSGGVDRIGLA
jgi:hypothetical protein